MSYSKQATPNTVILATVESVWLDARDKILLFAAGLDNQERAAPASETLENVRACALLFVRRAGVERSLEFPIDLAKPEDVNWLKAHPQAQICCGDTKLPLLVAGSNTALWVRPTTTEHTMVQLDDLAPSGQQSFLAMGLAALSLQAALGNKMSPAEAQETLKALASAQNDYVAAQLGKAASQMQNKSSWAPAEMH